MKEYVITFTKDGQNMGATIGASDKNEAKAKFVRENDCTPEMMETLNVFEVFEKQEFRLK